MGYGAIAVAGLIIAAGSAAYTVQNQRSQSRRQRRIQRLQERRRALTQIREARIRRAEILSSTTTAGAGGSSAQVGGAGSVSSQLSGNISFLDDVSAIRDQIARAQGRAAIAQGAGQVGQFISGQATQAFQAQETARAAGIDPNTVRSGTIFDFF